MITIFRWLACLLASAAVVTAAALTFELRWETNDDIAMAMVAHGYGIAGVSSPEIVFSNVLWGFLASSLPTWPDAQGYSILTLVAISVAMAAFAGGLVACEVRTSLALLVTGLVFFRPILFPQFTIVSGLFFSASIICLFAYLYSGKKAVVLLAGLLGFFSFLVRREEFLLLLFVVAPILPWRAMLHSFAARAVLLGMMVAIAFASYVNSSSYAMEEWQKFVGFNQVRSLYTDFNADAELLRQPTIYASQGFSENDVRLIGNWFFVDPDIADPEALTQMIKSLGKRDVEIRAYIRRGYEAVGAVFKPVLLPYILCAFLLLCAFPSRKVVTLWIFAAAAFFMLGLLGRGGLTRVYLPVISLLTLAPLLPHAGQSMGGSAHSWRIRTLTVGLTILVAVNSWLVAADSQAYRLKSLETRAAAVKLPTEFVVWGSGFPFESLYPVVGPRLSELRLHGLGVFTHAPFSNVRIDELRGIHLPERLTAKDGLWFALHEGNAQLLAAYCKERHGGRLIETDRIIDSNFNVVRYRCLVD